MANARELLRRRKSAQNTRKITRTMELVASAKLKKAQDAAEASRPYAEGLAELLAELSAAAESFEHPLLGKRPVKKVVLLIAASDRGLAGAFNANLLKRAMQRRREHLAAGREVEVVSLGKKVISTLKFLGVAVGQAHQGLMDAPRFEQARSIIEPLMQRFADGQIDQVEIVYSRFVSAAVQRPDRITVLPAGGDERAGAAAGSGRDYIFHPDPVSILQELIPQTVKTAFFSTLLQTSAGEHAARRIAMKNATDAAGDLIKALSRSYNRARQGRITQEISEIVGAVEAMK